MRKEVRENLPECDKFFPEFKSTISTLIHGGNVLNIILPLKVSLLVSLCKNVS